MEIQPAVLMFDNNQTSYEYTDTYFALTDGQGCPVKDAQVMLLPLDGGHCIQNPNGVYDPSSPPNEWWMLLTDETGFAKEGLLSKQVSVFLLSKEFHNLLQ